MGIFERYLTLWIAAAIAGGIALGALLPGAFGVLADLEVARVNGVVAVLIWVMIYPMMVNVDLASLRHIGDRPKGLAITVVVNWLVKPFTMAALGLLFFGVFFRSWVEPADARQYVAGMILLGAAPCTAMVFVWSQLTHGDATYTLVQVSVNDLIMVFAFAPLVALLLGVADVVVPWSTLLLSVVLYVVVPLVAGYLTRRALISRAEDGQRIAALKVGGISLELDLKADGPVAGYAEGLLAFETAGERADREQDCGESWGGLVAHVEAPCCHLCKRAGYRVG